MALVSETALIGGFHPLHPEISELAAAVASPENMEDIRLAREALVSKSNEHALWDTAGIIAFFATITTVVDFAGHFSDELPKVLKKLAKVISSGRHLRATCRRVLCCQTA
ncbi:unnamed protein product [Durusdinium trenchii]|uniref:Uncharacterized protein n=2 Tax=Durusdinium trenchii TaxID=1381693 RepID=A0ABP0SQK6_9DINO